MFFVSCFLLNWVKCWGKTSCVVFFKFYFRSRTTHDVFQVLLEPSEHEEIFYMEGQLILVLHMSFCGHRNEGCKAIELVKMRCEENLLIIPWTIWSTINYNVKLWILTFIHNALLYFSKGFIT